MKIGVPKEIKDQEGRVGITPAGVHKLVDAEHTVIIQSGATHADERARRTDGNSGNRLLY